MNTDFRKSFIKEYGYTPYIHVGLNSTLTLWFLYGCNPVSCTSALLDGDYNRAMSHAHPHLLMPYQCSKTYLEASYDYIQFLFGETILDTKPWNGWSHLDDEIKAMAILEKPWLLDLLKHRKGIC